AEDWWAIWCGAFILAVSFLAVWLARPQDLAQQAATDAAIEVSSPLKPYVSKPGSWKENPVEAFYKPATEDKKATNALPGMLGAFVVIGVVFAVAMQVRDGSGAAFLKAFPVVFLLAVLAYAMAGQSVIKAYNLEY